MPEKKILIAAGGTGGHMFPAQALAKELKEKGHKVHFAGANLDTNRYFYRHEFTFTTVSSSTLKSGNLFSFCGKMLNLLRGFIHSYFFIKKFKPDIVVGFGSFHSATVLAAATVSGKPFVIFESNAWPGKVNRIFSRFAVLNAVQFSKTADVLKGRKVFASVPFWNKSSESGVSKECALAYFGLENKKNTILVFGGSQGARSLNDCIVSSILALSSRGIQVQVIHFTGHDCDPNIVRNLYEKSGIPCSVKNFEDHMAYAWSAADICICRSGAATVSEIVKFAVPAILIPFPRAAENHQKINADELYKIGGAFYLEEKYLNQDSIGDMLGKILDEDIQKSMNKALINFRTFLGSSSLSNVVEELLYK